MPGNPGRAAGATVFANWGFHSHSLSRHSEPRWDPYRHGKSRMSVTAWFGCTLHCQAARYNVWSIFRNVFALEMNTRGHPEAAFSGAAARFFQLLCGMAKSHALITKLESGWDQDRFVEVCGIPHLDAKSASRYGAPGICCEGNFRPFSGRRLRRESRPQPFFSADGAVSLMRQYGVRRASLVGPALSD